MEPIVLLSIVLALGVASMSFISWIQYRHDVRIANETANLARRYAEELAYHQKVESGLIPTTQPRA